MTEKEMIDCLQSVWENMTTDKNVDDYQKMLVLLEEMTYLLRYDYQIDYPPPPEVVESSGEKFVF